MGSDEAGERVPATAMRAALEAYLGQIWAERRISVPGFLFPALGNVFIFYLPPIVVAGVLGDVAAGEVLAPNRVRDAVLVFGALWLVGEGCWRIGIHLLNRTDARGIAALFEQGMADLLRRDLAFFHDNFAGSLTKRVTSYAQKYEQFVDTLIFNVVGNLLPLAVAAAILAQRDLRLVAVLVGGTALTGVLVLPLIRSRQEMVDAREAASATVAGHVADTLGNIDAVRAHAAEAGELAVHRANVEVHRRLALRSWDHHNLKIDGVAAPISAVVNGLGLLVALQIGGTGGIEVESVFLTFAYYVQATRILFDFNQVYRNLENSLTEAAQLTTLLAEEPSVVDVDDPDPLDPVDASIRLERVRFAHRGADLLFDGLDLEIASGERVGLVGRSGGGKSTLVQLLLRTVDVQGGRILVGGQDAARLSQADLRSLFATVPQDPAMFHRSIADNIAFGQPGATRTEVEAAAAAAHATAFVSDLPDGFDTLVGERGVKLSGGQRQRIAIARAILRDAPILLLDEATSALDSESEAHIQDALAHLLRGRTAVVIAHRLSTLSGMDRLVVLDRGRVLEQGTHDQLLAADGTYAGLWRRQSGGFLVEEALAG